MKSYKLDDLKGNLEGILKDAATGDEFSKIEVRKGLTAVIINEAEWNIMCEALAMLIGGQKIKTKE